MKIPFKNEPFPFFYLSFLIKIEVDEILFIESSVHQRVLQKCKVGTLHFYSIFKHQDTHLTFFECTSMDRTLYGHFCDLYHKNEVE